MQNIFVGTKRRGKHSKNRKPKTLIIVINFTKLNILFYYRGKQTS